MVDRGIDFPILLVVQWISLEIGVWVHPHSEILCGAALPGAFLNYEKQHALEKHFVLNVFFK